MKNSVFIWGSKSYALLVDNLIKNQSININPNYLKTNKKNLKIKYIFDPYSKKKIYNLSGSFFNDLKSFKKKIKTCKSYVVCIGNNYGKARYFVSAFIEKFGLEPVSLISKHSFIENSALIGKGVVAMPRSFVNAFSKIGDFTILNCNSNIEHESKIGKGCHIMSGACIGGRSVVGDFTTVGTNATVLPDIKIGSGSYIGAGSVVTKNVKPNSVIVGVPGRRIKEHENKVDKKIFEKIKLLND